MPQAKITIKNHYSPSERVLSPKGIKPAKQEFKADTDLNTIMRKFQKTGAIDHSKIHQGSYGIASPVQLHEALNLVNTAETMFNELPSSLRNKFENNAEKFLAFVQDDKNYDEARNLGLLLEPAAQAAAEEAAGAASPGAEVGQEPDQPPS